MTMFFIAKWSHNYCRASAKNELKHQFLRLHISVS